MTEIYWIQRIGALSDLFCIVWTVGLFVSITMIVCLVIAVTEDYDDKIVLRKLKKYTKISFVTTVIGVLGDIFTPSTKEMYAIYGIGGTIDYIKSNDKAKELPNKVVDALTRYVENIEKDNSNNDK